MTGTSVVDICTSTTPTACLNDMAGIMADSSTAPGVVIPAGGSVSVYVARYSDSTQDGTFKLNVRVE